MTLTAAMAIAMAVLALVMDKNDDRTDEILAAMFADFKEFFVTAYPLMQY